jgi:pyruvate dehydrogenase E2 component (dihydrolipoamide acetyltransferase)
MTTQFTLPDVGDNVSSGTVVGVLVSVGDTIQIDTPVLELETDKATVEVPSGVGGVITALHVQEGDIITVGQPLLSVDAPASAAPSTPAEPAAPAAPAAAPVIPTPPPAAPPPTPVASAAPIKEVVELRIPDLGDNIDTGNVVGVLVSVGDTIEIDQGILELETDKATVEVPATVGGVVKEIHVQEGDKIGAGGLVLVVETTTTAAAPSTPAAAPVPAAPAPPDAAAPPAAASSAAPTSPAVTPSSASVNVPAVMASVESDGLPLRTDRIMVAAAPNVRRIARELGVNISEVEGAGPGGRILMDDVKRHAFRMLRALRAGLPLGETTARPAAPPLPDFGKWGQVERQPMSGIRKATARHMEVAWSNIPHVTQFDKADITELEQLRHRFGPKVEAAGAKLTITAILLKVVAGALKEFPQFCASIDMGKEEIVYKKYYHVGVAVDTPRGLLVPVIREVDQKNILDLAVELGQLAEKARDRKLAPAEMQGGVFSITNLGGIGGTNFTPIVNSPEVAILGVARGSMEPVYNKQSQTFEPRLRVPLALSYDHRVIDGADGARFLRWIVEHLEQPFLTALQGW